VLHRYAEREREREREREKERKRRERWREYLTWDDLFVAVLVFFSAIIRDASVLTRQCLALVGRRIDITFA